MLKNLRNVAVPKTGLPLSLLCASRAVALPFLVLGYPLLCLAAAASRVTGTSPSLLSPSLLSPMSYLCIVM